jgi:hypothetical protein
MMDGNTEVLSRLSRIETLLLERCDARQKTLDDHSLRLRVLEKAENKRKGGIAVLGVLMTLAAAAGAAAVKLLGN